MFSPDRPLYLQIRDRIADAILDGRARAGEPLASVRALAAELAVNPLTVAKAYQELQAGGFVEARKGVGLFPAPDARARLLAAERKTFLADEWPRLKARLDRLGLGADDLFQTA